MSLSRLALLLVAGLILASSAWAEEGAQLGEGEIAAMEALEDELGPIEQRTHFWFNDLTAESQWGPTYEYTDPASGDVYYVDPDTKETSWDKPDSLKWVEREDADGKGVYFYNEGTGASQWEKPTMLAWRLVSVTDGDVPNEDEQEHEDL